MIRLDPRLLRLLLAAAGAAAIVALAVAITGGFAVTAGGQTIRARNPVPPLAIAAVLTALAFAGGRQAAAAASAWWWAALERHAAAAAIVVAAATVYAGVAWGTFAAGGSDSYCYLNQAELFTRGAVADAEPLALDPGWPGSPDAFVPVGHNPSPRQPGAFVPICPAGYSLVLAGARMAGGRTAMFWVTPLMGGLLVVMVFLLGRQLAGPAAGLFAAILTASSPIVLYQVIQPMNDVPAAALWTAALVAALRERGGPLARALTAGALTGMAITIRPNLVPLAAVLGAMTIAWCYRAPLVAQAFRPRDGDGGRAEASAEAVRAAPRRAGRLQGLRETLSERGRLRPALLAAAAFGAAAAPGAFVVMAVQQAMHGSPLRSGYGDLSAIFSLSHVWPNLVLYPMWVIEAHTPFILLAAAAPIVLDGTRRRSAQWLLAFAAATLACYLPYVVFDAWWYQRFLLPAVPAMLALTAAVAVGALRPLAPAARTVVFTGVAAALVTTCVQTAAGRGVFGLHQFEARFRAAGAYVAALAPDAAVITTHHSGGIRFYAGRSTAGWDSIDPGRLSEAVAFFRARGRTPYLVLEAAEQPAFRARFEGDPLGSLEWPPMAEIDRVVRIYDPADHARYMRGEQVRVEHLRSVGP